MSNLPIVPVKQRASDDVAMLVRWQSGLAEVHYYRPGAVEWMVARYSEPVEVSGLRWQITLAGPNENGE